jgi:hypothetical protein
MCAEEDTVQCVTLHQTVMQISLLTENKPVENECIHTCHTAATNELNIDNTAAARAVPAGTQ